MSAGDIVTSYDFDLNLTYNFTILDSTGIFLYIRKGNFMYPYKGTFVISRDLIDLSVLCFRVGSVFEAGDDDANLIIKALFLQLYVSIFCYPLSSFSG